MVLRKRKLSDYLKDYQVEWAGNLPENCPPEEILEPDDEQAYRFLRSKDRIEDADFLPYVELYPERQYEKRNLILANGLSVLAEIDLSDAKKRLSESDFCGMAKLTLNPPDGVLVKSGGKNHYTLWRTTSLDIDKAEIIDVDET